MLSLRQNLYPVRQYQTEMGAPRIKLWIKKYFFWIKNIWKKIYFQLKKYFKFSILVKAHGRDPVMTKFLMSIIHTFGLQKWVVNIPLHDSTSFFVARAWGKKTTLLPDESTQFPVSCWGAVSIQTLIRQLLLLSWRIETFMLFVFVYLDIALLRHMSCIDAQCLFIVS